MTAMPQGCTSACMSSYNVAHHTVKAPIPMTQHAQVTLASYIGKEGRLHPRASTSAGTQAHNFSQGNARHHRSYHITPFHPYGILYWGMHWNDLVA